MGYIRHHAIAVTSWDIGKISIIHEKAVDLFGSIVSELIESPVNTYISFFIAPDGSKEGWSESELHDSKRAKFIKEVNKLKYSDGSNSVRYCEFFYGDDNDESKILNHN